MGEVFYFSKIINKLVCSVNILVMYANNLFGMTLMKRLTKEGDNIICADKTLAEIDKKIATHSYNLDYSDSVDEIFRIHNLEGVIFIGDTLIDGSVPHSNGEFLEKTLDLCEKHKVKKFLYVTQTTHEINEHFAMRCRVDKFLCQEYASHNKTAVKVLEFDNVFAAGMECGIVLRMLKTVELNGEWEETAIHNIFYLDDAVDVVCRVWKGAGSEVEYLVRNPQGTVEGKELFACLTSLFQNSKGVLTLHTDEATKDFLADISWKPKYALKEKLPKVVQWFKERNKPKATSTSISLKDKLVPYLENLGFFGLIVLISFFLQDGSTVNLYTGVDFAYVYIIAIGLLYGKSQSAISIFLSCALLCYKYIYHGADWIGILYQVQPMVHMATYLFLGTMVGYITDNKNKTLSEVRMQLRHTQDRFNFLYRNYVNISGIKDVFYKQILNTSDSMGKIYSVMTKMESVRREELYCAACEVVAEFLDVESVAIYTMGRSPYYLRLRVRQGEATTNLSKSLKVEAFPYLQSILSKHTVFQNKDLQEALPDMAVPVLFDDKVIAVIQVYDVPFERFSLQSEIMLKVVSLLIASAIRKAALYEEGIREKMYVAGTRFFNVEHFAYHVGEAKRQHELEYRTFQKAQLVSFKGEELRAEKLELLAELSDVLDRIIREDDMVGVNSTGELEALLFNLPDEFKASVQGRFAKEGIEIKWISQ